jgi:hypothetical protein
MLIRLFHPIDSVWIRRIPADWHGIFYRDSHKEGNSGPQQAARQCRGCRKPLSLITSTASMEEAMSGVSQAIKRLQGKRRCRTLLLLGIMLAAASLVSMPPDVPGEPVAEEEVTAEEDTTTEGLAAGEEDVEEACAAADEATAEACAAEEEMTAAILPTAEVEEVPSPPSAAEPAPGAATVDDSFDACSKYCWGYARFVDYGPGAPGGGNNDDYVRVCDFYAGDHDGVKAYAWIGNDYQGSKYNGKGAGECVVWDPFPNVKPGQTVGLKVCLVDGPNGAPYYCDEDRQKSQDG